MNTNMTGFRCFSKIFVLWTNVDLALEGLIFIISSLSCIVAVIAWQRADEELKELSPESTDHGTKMKLYERMGDSAAALEKYRKALKYYHKMVSI